jgi:hypothetical protein
MPGEERAFGIENADRELLNPNALVLNTYDGRDCVSLAKLSYSG